MKLTVTQEEIVKRIFREHLPKSFVCVFGSRKSGTKKEFADLDLLVTAKRPLSIKQLAKLKDAFTESDLPFRVDIVDTHAVSQEFLKSIETEIIVRQD